MQFNFQSNQLDKALELVRGQHKSRKERYRGVTSSVIGEVREMLQGTQSDDIPKLAFSFNPQQLVSCVHIVALDKEGDVAEKAVKVATLRPRQEMIQEGWFGLVGSYPNNLLEKLTRGLIQLKGYSILENHQRVSNSVSIWFMSADLSSGILKDYAKTDQNLYFDAYLSEHYLNDETPLYHFLWFTLLTAGAKSDLLRQLPKRILQELENVQQSASRVKIASHYLNKLGVLDNWDDTILEYINEKYDKPKRLAEKTDLENRFWERVNDKAKEEFRRWLIRQQVESFFEGDRARFWRRYVDMAQVRDAQEILDGDGFMLDFGQFGVIEFKNVGNAAYVYPKDVFNRFWSRSRFADGHPRDFKELSKTARTRAIPEWDGRIVHPPGWEYRAEFRINTLLAGR